MFKSSIDDLPAAFKDYIFHKTFRHSRLPKRYVNDFNLTKIKIPFPTTNSWPRSLDSLSRSMRYSKSVKHFRKQLKQKLTLVYE